MKQKDIPGSGVRWLCAGTRDGLYRYQVAVDVVDHGKKTAYLLRVRRGFQLELAKTVRGNASPRVFSN